MLLFLSLLLAAYQATSSSLIALEPTLFNSIMSEANPTGTQKNLDDLQILIGIGERERVVAIKNQSIAQGIYDDALEAWQKAFDEEQAALADQKAAEKAEVDATAARDRAIDFRDLKIKEKKTADDAVPPAKKFMDDEIKRVKEEHDTLNKVKKILEDLLPKAAIETNSRKLLSRMATLLSNPSFLEQLKKANPGAVQQVIKMVVALIDKGTEEKEKAIQKYNDRVTEAATAAQNLVDASAALDEREEELKAATANRIAKTKIAEGKTAVEKEKRGIRDAKKAKLETQKEFTAREIKRIDFEKSILQTGHDQESTLKEVLIVLQD